MTLDQHIESVFTPIYENNSWGDPESRSGYGSTVERSIGFRNGLKYIKDTYSIHSMLDLSCGDWAWMKECKDILDDYTGVDVVQSMIDRNNHLYESDKIRFFKADMLLYLMNRPDKSVDLAWARQTLEHLPTEYNLRTIEQLKRVAKYFIITGQNEAHGTENKDITFGAGSRGIRLHSTPYIEVLGKPVYIFNDCIPTTQYIYEGYLYTTTSKLRMPYMSST